MRGKVFLQKMILGLASVVVGLVLAELLLRVWTPGSLKYKAVRRSDPVLHHALIPSSAYVHRERDFSVEVRTNALGFRDREHRNDPAGAFKLIVLGDSFVEGYGVPMESCFVRMLEVKLNSDGHRSRPVVVYNLGVAGYSPLIEYLVLKHQGLALKPDLVILCYDMSDVQEDVLYAMDAEFDSVGAPARVNPSWPSFGHITLVPRSEIKTMLRENSYLYTLLADATMFFKPKPLYDIGNINAGQFMHTVDSSSAAWEKYFAQSQSYVGMIAGLCRSEGVAFVLATYPRGNQVGPGEWKEGRKEWGLDTLTHNSAIFGSLKEFSQRNDMRFLDMTAAFRIRSRGNLYLPFDGHWTSRGHSVAADTLADFLLQHQLVPR